MQTINNNNWVQSCITNVSFPKTLRDVSNMILKNCDICDINDQMTDMDVLLEFNPDWDICWTAPKWFTKGDILFFYHAVTAKQRIRSLLKKARQIADDRLITILTHADDLTNRYSGKIFGCAEATESSVYFPDDGLIHFKSRIFAPLGKVHIFKTPLEVDRFAGFVTINRQGSLTFLGKREFEGIRQQLSENNELPDFLQTAEFSESGFRNINKTNWVSIACNEKAKFLHEVQIKSYFIDYFLDELKDKGTPLLEECHCFRENTGTGFADYFIRVSGKWIPVEAKLNIKAEKNLFAQVDKYIHIDSFVPTKGSHKGDTFSTHDNPFCIVIDQFGGYLTHEGSFHECHEDIPLWKRTDIHRNIMPMIRDNLKQHIA